MHTLDLAAPYAFAILFYLIAPLLMGFARNSVSAALDRGRANDPGINWREVPDFLMPESIELYVEYATDAAQAVPALLLPVIGAVYGFSAGVPTPLALTFLMIAFIAAITMLSWMVGVLPADYVARKRFGYSVLTIAGILLNLVGMSLALAFS